MRLVSQDQQPLRIGLLGAGNVGGAVARALLRGGAKRLAAFAGRPLQLVRIVARKPETRAQQIGADFSLFSTRVDSVAGARDIDVVAALMGGLAEEDAIKIALASGQHVVTANKAVIAKSGPELERLASHRDRALLYEAAVGGATPIIRNLRSCAGFLNINRVQAILNGTCNYILSQLEHGAPMDVAIGKAQHKGLAEADPSLDVEGRDAAQKLIILMGLAAGVWFREAEIATRGITRLEPEDTRAARLLGCSLALIAEAARGGDHPSAGWEASVEPRLIPQDSLLAKVSAEAGAVAFQADPGGPFFFSALGAGGEPTAVSVLSDLAAVARGSWKTERNVSLANVADASALTPSSLKPMWRYIRALSPQDAQQLEKIGNGVFRFVEPEKCPRALATTRPLPRVELNRLIGPKANDYVAIPFLEPLI
jgi:homoserine dehydrogenase